MKANEVMCATCELIKMHYSRLTLEIIDGYIGLDTAITIDRVKFCPKCGRKIEDENKKND